MKKSELLQKQEQLRDNLEVIRTATVDADRMMNADETASFESISRELKEIETNLNAIKLADENAAKRSITILKPESKKPKTNLQAVRSLVDDGRNCDTVLRANELNAPEIKTGGVFISRTGEYSMVTDAANVSATQVKPMNIIEGIPSLWSQMNATVYNDLKGTTATLPFMDPMAGTSATAEKGAMALDETATNSVTLTPLRSGVVINVTREALAGFSEGAWNSILNNAYETIDRQITTKVYAAIIAGATEVAAATAVDAAGFNALAAACAVDGSFFMPRTTFFTAKGDLIDAGSGRFLAERTTQDKGVTYDGYEIFHSGLFDITAEYYTYGINKNITIGFWGNDSYEVIVDETTGAATGELKITISKINDVKIPNVAKAFFRSVDLT